MCVGAKYHKANDAVRVILRDGSLRTLSTPSSVTELSEEGQEMCQYVSEVSELLSYLVFCFSIFIVFNVNIQKDTVLRQLYMPNNNSNSDNNVGNEILMVT